MTAATVASADPPHATMISGEEGVKVACNHDRPFFADKASGEAAVSCNSNFLLWPPAPH